ncbi:unnamed protein product [Euphydryas editha]|uniref:Uncharacterized protein n=1 Tax=Euphydryas editha TaxID=104508 RepID=A0AAU9TN85_EUPED|nr:unnamed protein product [Euphydryas editha]
MTLTPKVIVSPVSNVKINRGVEARENEIANIRFETEQLSSSRPATECSESRTDGVLAAGDAPTRPLSPPSISDQSGGENNAVPAAVLLACPAFAALHQHSWDKARSLLDASTRAAEPLPHGFTCAANFNSAPQHKTSIKKNTKKSFWKNLCDEGKQNFDTFDNGPDRIEVYHFERSNEYLCARDAARVTRVERAARRLARPAGALLAELLAVPRVLLAVPVHILLQIGRCMLLGIRGALTGVLQTVSDQLLKPSLALAFNALVQPPLVFAAQTAGALRDVVRAAALALSDALEPVARLLSSLRVVHIERRCACTQQV